MAGASQESGVKYKGNIATLFPKIKICKLRFEFSSRSGSEERTEKEHIFVEQLEKEGRIDKMKTDLKKTTQLSFTNADMGVVTAKLKESIPLKESEKWMEEVRNVVYNINKVYSAVFETGQLSEKILQDLKSTYPEAKASCYLSTDKQSLLVTSSDDEEMQAIRRFVESRMPETKVMQTKQPFVQPVRVSEKKSPVTKTTTVSISPESQKESDQRSPVAKTSGATGCSKSEDIPDKKSPSSADMDSSPTARNVYGTKSPGNKTTGSRCSKSDDEFDEKLPKAKLVATSGSPQDDMSEEKSNIRPPDMSTSFTAERNKLPVSSQEVTSASGEVDPSPQSHTKVSVATADGQASARFDAGLHPQGNTVVESASKHVQLVTINEANHDISSGIVAQTSHQQTSAQPLTSGGRLDHTLRQEISLEPEFNQSVDKDLKPTEAQPPSTMKRTVEVSEQFVRLLRGQHVRQDFFRELENSGVEIDGDSIASGHIVITQGDREKVIGALQRVITTLDLADRVKDKDVSQALGSLRKQFPDQVEFDESSLRIIFHTKVEAEVNAEVEIAVCRPESISLSLEEMNYIQYHLSSIRQSASNSEVNLNVEEGDGIKGVLVISPPPANISAVKSMIEEMRANLYHKKENMEISEAVFLTGVKGQMKVEELERRNKCLISVFSPGHQVLMRVKSVSGCRLILCEGSMAASDCDVMVFPLTENQKEWPLSQRVILEKGLLASSTEPYKLLCGAPPKPSILRAQCQGSGAGQMVVMVSVQNDLTAVGGSTVGDGLREALMSSLVSGASVAVPVSADAALTLAHNLTMLLQTIDRLDRDDEKVSNATVVLYLENISDAERREVAKTVENVLKQPQWCVETDVVAVYGETDKSSPSLVISGLQEDVEKTFTELKSMQVPDKYKVHARMIATVSSKARPQAVKHLTSAAEAINKDRNLCTLTVPRCILQGIDQEKFARSPAGTAFQTNFISKNFLECRATTGDLHNLVNFLSESLGAGSASERCKDRSRGTENLPAQQKESRRHSDYLLKLEALQYLLGEDFAEITILDTEGKSVKIQVSSQCDKLMREDIPINDTQWGDVLNAGRKIQSEGIKAFIKPLFFQGKVAIVTLDQDAMMKAKWLITSGTEKSRSTTNNPVKPVGEPSDGGDFTTKSGIRVSVYKTDITKLVVDVIVNAANGRLMHGGGVAAAIARAAGRALDEEGRTFVERFGQLDVSEVLPTTSGNLPCKTVFHAVGPCWYDYQNKDKCGIDLQQTVFNCLKKAHSLKFTSIAVSSISSAIFGVPEEVCAQMYLRAVQQFERQHGGETQVQHIHFVDVREVMVSVIRDTFSRQWNSDTLSPSGVEGNTQNPSRREHNEDTPDSRRRGFSDNQDPGRQQYYKDSQVLSRRDHDDTQGREKNYKNIQDSSRQEYNYDSRTASRQESNIGSQEYSRDNEDYNRGNSGTSNLKHGRDSEDYGKGSQEHGRSFQEHSGVNQDYRMGSQDYVRGFQEQNQGASRQASNTDAQESRSREQKTQQFTDPRGSARRDHKSAQDRSSGGDDQPTLQHKGRGRGGKGGGHGHKDSQKGNKKKGK